MVAVTDSFLYDEFSPLTLPEHRVVLLERLNAPEEFLPGLLT